MAFTATEFWEAFGSNSVPLSTFTDSFRSASSELGVVIPGFLDDIVRYVIIGELFFLENDAERSAKFKVTQRAFDRVVTMCGPFEDLISNMALHFFDA